MCTLVFGVDVFGPRSVLIATNRDEDPARGSEPPQVLRRAPRVLGGRDAVARGTWLAARVGPPREPSPVREREARVALDPGTGSAQGQVGVAMLLNRHDPDPARPGRRSRGLLTLDVASAQDPRATVEAEAATGRYAPCSLVWLSTEESWLLAIRAEGAPTLEPIAPGWHAITHFELDDPSDPRATWLLSGLSRERPGSRAEAETRMRELLAGHGSERTPSVCQHSGRAPTVSAALLWLAPGEFSYRHAQGPPCVTPFEDWTHLVTSP